MKHALFALALLGGASAALAEDMVITTEVPATHWKAQYIDQFAALVEERSDGELDVQVFPAGQLYTDRDALAAIGSGAVQMVWPISGQLEALDARAGIVGLPFTLTDDLVGNPEFAAEFAAFLSSLLEDRNIAILGLLRAADAIFVMKSQPVTQLSDLSGLRIRAPGGGAQARDLVTSLGASPINLAASEMVTSMTQGVIDGVLTSPAGWKTILADTASEGAIVPGILLATYSLAVDNTWLNGLSEKNRNAVISAASDIAATQWSGAVEKDIENIDAMIASGANFNRISGAEKEEFRVAAQPVIDSFANAHPDTWQVYNDLVAKYAQ